MSAFRLDCFTRLLTVAPFRRDLLRGLVGTALGLTSAGLPHIATARNNRKHKKRKKKLKRNEFGCVDVGKACRGKDANCCSGICKGKKPKKGEKDTSACAAHDTGGCQAGAEPCAGANELCTTSLGLDGTCYTTTGQAGYCGTSNACQVCSRDADCEEQLGPRAACVLCAGCADTGGTLCVAPD